jgi:hypothetical protein
MCRIICNRLLEVELPHFKAAKSRQYVLLMKASAAAMRMEGEQVRVRQHIKALRLETD